MIINFKNLILHCWVSWVPDVLGFFFSVFYFLNFFFFFSDKGEEGEKGFQVISFLNLSQEFVSFYLETLIFSVSNFF